RRLQKLPREEREKERERGQQELEAYLKTAKEGQVEIARLDGDLQRVRTDQRSYRSLEAESGRTVLLGSLLWLAVVRGLAWYLGRPAAPKTPATQTEVHA